MQKRAPKIRLLFFRCNDRTGICKLPIVYCQLTSVLDLKLQLLRVIKKIIQACFHRHFHFIVR